MPRVDASWVSVCEVGELLSGHARVLDEDPPIAVFNVDGEYFAIDDTCTHAQSSLAAGYIEDGTVECEMHFAKFCIRTGAALTPPASVPLQRYPVEVIDDVVHVDLSSRRGHC